MIIIYLSMIHNPRTLPSIQCEIQSAVLNLFHNLLYLIIAIVRFHISPIET